MKLLLGDCQHKLKELEPNSIDSIVTDPPYGLKFMSKDWDHGIPGTHFWEEALRVAKPGAFLLAFGGTRTFHRLTCYIEDAGWEIRDCIMWVYGSGFPKSHDVSKAIDKEAGVEREVVGRKQYKASNGGETFGDYAIGEQDITSPATEDAKQWDGWGTALKPAWEPIIVARKPLVGTVASNVLQYGTGGINVDGCRVGTEERTFQGMSQNTPSGAGTFRDDNWQPKEVTTTVTGRWPANLIHDGSDEVLGLFPETGASKATPRNNGDFQSNSKGQETSHVTYGHDDNGGSAARFFYCAKASKSDRGVDNDHATVKPLSLMEYLVRLVTQPNGICLDPFMGSGTTGVACNTLGMNFIGIEKDPNSYSICLQRLLDMPPILFLIYQNSTILYHCHNILELFRLREVYQPDLDTVEVYRYVDTQVSVQTDKYFSWDKDKLVWVEGKDIGFQRITYASLEPIYNLLKGMK